MKKNRIDLAFLSIVSMGPVLWFIDCLAISIIFKINFVQQLLSPRSFDLILCLLLLFFPFFVALIFHPRIFAQEKSDEQKAIEESVHREEMLKSEEAMRVLQQKADERVKELETGFVAELESKLALERKRVEELIRLEEQKKAEEAVQALRRKFDELMRAGQEDERKRISDLVRMEEQKKMGEQIRALDDKYAQQVSSRLAEERKQIEDVVRIEEQKKAEEAVRALRQRYEELLRNEKK